jgi:superfamily II DNA or RNA helicase
LDLTEDEAALSAAVGVRTFLEARALVTRGELTHVEWSRSARKGHALLRGATIGRVTASVVIGPDGAVKSVHGECSCRRAPACAHPTALVLIAGGIDGLGRPQASWESALAALVEADSSADEPGSPDLALQFELEAAQHGGSLRIGLRPVVPGKKGWVRTVNWSSLEYAYVPASPRAQHRVDLLLELSSLAAVDVQLDPRGYSYYGSTQRVIYLDQFYSRRVWDVLAEAREAGLPFVESGKAATPISVSARPVRFSVRADRADADLRLRPVLLHGADVIDPARSVMIGDPAHGVAWWGVLEQDDPETLRLAPTARPVGVQAMDALLAPAIVVPAADESRFLRHYYPGLVRRADVVPLDETTSLPVVAPATLTLTARYLSGQRMSLTWEWVSVIGSDIAREPLYNDIDQSDDRADTLRRATNLVSDPAYGLTEPGHGGLRLLSGAVVTGDTMLRVVRDVLPTLADTDGLDVVVEFDDDAAEYVEEDAAPVVSFTSADNDSAGQPDWFDLAVTVTVGGEEVAFEGLFVALAAAQEFMILPSGRYFKLDQPEFRRLHDLIAEAREMQDAPPSVLRVGRFQAGVWQDLSEVGQIAGQAAAWQESVRSLMAAGSSAAAEAPPAGMVATMRPYQVEGFQWLAALYRHDLGGVLADDMGLGKTLQTLALICHVVENARTESPFLVVAPASVVSNWADEAARFVPDLDVRTIVQTRARRTETLEQAASGAHIVVTSYTLFRLEYDEYAALPWAGLILDEAQFVKNVQSQAYRIAKQLPVSFKVAITGTPMENNLSELWALLSITAPGLLSRLDRFTDYYRKPIERERDQERLAQLRRRIRPLMLRRRKTEVAEELPAKQEQIVELTLNPKHRKIYQTYLHRERQKVLGLLGDLQKNRFEIFRSLTLLRQASLDVSLVDPKHEAVASTKLDALAERVSDIVAEGHRILIFSQFTRFLTAARQRLENTGIACSYLDGKTRQRAQVIADFKTGTTPVFLVSLKSGGFGLNLTEADYCILLDPWWNPATEAQATDRVHRIGQTRKVMVYRFVAQDTIEEKVMALQARKAELFSSVLDGGDFASAALTAADIQSLLE